MAKSSGFTLLELIVTVAILSILATIAVPSFSSLVRSNRATSEANSFLVALTLARSEAIKRNTTTVVCKSSDGTSCSTAGSDTWNKGLIVFVDSNYTGSDNKVCSNHVIDTDDPILRTEYPFSNFSTISGGTMVKDCIIYGSDGRMLNTFSTTVADTLLSFVPVGTTTSAPRKIEINTLGRPRIWNCSLSGNPTTICP